VPAVLSVTSLCENREALRVPGSELLTMIARDGRIRAALAHRRLVREARRREDDDLMTNAPWRDLVELLKLSKGARLIVELGTGNAWTTHVLAADNRSARVVTFDPLPSCA
jgi:predicted O-methyltransferase YrrM